MQAERERAERAERLLAARDHELNSYRRALGEQAESLAEERARAAQEQAKAQAAQAERAQLEQDAQAVQLELTANAQAAREELEQLKLSMPGPKTGWSTRSVKSGQ